LSLEVYQVQDSIAAEKPQVTIPPEGRTFHGTVTRVAEDRSLLRDKPVRYEMRIKATDCAVEVTLDAPLPFYGDYDVTIKPVEEPSWSEQMSKTGGETAEASDMCPR
jgi:hypothetical protein